MPKAGEVDPIWDTLTEIFGKVGNDVDRGLRNEAVRLLRQSGATPEEIRIAHRFCKENLRGFFTEMAVAKYYSRAQHELAQPTSPALALVRKMSENE